jgi:hypothetical protein
MLNLTGDKRFGLVDMVGSALELDETGESPSFIIPIVRYVRMRLTEYVAHRKMRFVVCIQLLSGELGSSCSGKFTLGVLY